MSSEDLSPVDLAALYGVSTGTLANWRVQGKGPPHRNKHNYRNGTVKYLRSQAIRWGKTNGYISKKRK